MEGTWLRRRRPEKAHVGVVLLFMCGFIHTQEMTQKTPVPQCRHGDYLNDEQGICCNKCPPGFKLLKKCPSEGRTSTCERCPEGQYSDEINYAPNCMKCKRCKDSLNEFELSPCKYNRNSVCRCKDGFYRADIDDEKYECLRCSECRPDERERHMCTPTNNTICDCKEEHYRVNSRCQPCTICSPKCKHLCTSPSTANDPSSSFYVNIIAGIVSVVVVMFAAVTLITHKVTKHLVKRRLNHHVSQQPNVSPSTCEDVMILTEEPQQTSSAIAYSTSDQEVSNLPDCIPLEIKTSDLIYTVLDLVPVLQVKQLVRSLGVNDTEIQEAELDYRPCREAHYQMLRVWAERGSRAGGGGRGGMLHRPLLEELLDKLRTMYLGQAAEELEAKYDIQ